MRLGSTWKNAQQTDPFSYLQKVACSKFFFLSRRYDEALGHFSEPQKYGPLPLEVLLYQALIYVQLGQLEEAKKLTRMVQRSAGAQLSLRAWIAELLARCGEITAALAIVDEFKLVAPGTSFSKFRQASLLMALGDSEAALSSLASAFADKEPELPWLAVDPRFDSIRSVPQFQEIVSKLKLINSA